MASYWQIFTVFAKIGAFTIGGGYAMLSIIQKEIVSRGWLKDEDFTDIVTLAQSAPGLLAVNISIFTGYRLRGTKGSVIATLGCILPPFAIILAIAMAFSGYQDNPTVIKIFKGIRPVVVALMFAPIIGFTKGMRGYIIAIAAAISLIIWYMGISPVYILFAGGVVGVLLAALRGKEVKQ